MHGVVSLFTVCTQRIKKTCSDDMELPLIQLKQTLNLVHLLYNYKRLHIEIMRLCNLRCDRWTRLDQPSVPQISILKSLVIPAIWLALSNVTHSQITVFFALNHNCSKSHHVYNIVYALYLKYNMRCKNLLFLLFNKSATWSIKY